MVNFICYFAAIFVSESSNPVVLMAAGLIPPLSCFIAPSLFIVGKMSLPLLLLSLLLQILMIVLLIVICARVYRKLVMIDDRKLKLVEILKLAKE